jgi:hypothetical protein
VILDFESLVLFAVPATPNLCLVFITPRTPSLRTLDIFESLVVPFGLTNAPASCQEFINDILQPFLDIFFMAFLNDILIPRNNLREHREHVTAVMTSHKEAGLYMKVEKYQFHTEEVQYLGLIVGVNGIRIDPEKMQAVENWEPQKNSRKSRPC